MKKQDMINIIREREKEAWEKLAGCEKELGENHGVTRAMRNRWVSLNRLLRDLGIEEER